MRISDWSSDVCSSDLCPTQWSETLSYKDPYFGTAAQYEADFKKVYPEYKAVPYQTAQGSAAILVFKDAFERAGSFAKEKGREALAQTERSDERRVGKECIRQCRTRCVP